MVHGMQNECLAERIPARPPPGSWKSPPNGTSQAPASGPQTVEGQLAKWFVQGVRVLGVAALTGFQCALSLSSHHPLLKPQGLAYLCFCLYNAPKLAFTFSPNRTQKPFALEQNTLLKQGGTRAGAEVRGPDSRCSGTGSPTPQHPLGAGV